MFSSSGMQSLISSVLNFFLWIQSRRYQLPLQRQFYVQMSQLSPVLGTMNLKTKNKLFRIPIPPQQFLQSLLKCFFRCDGGQLCIFISLLKEVFFFYRTFNSISIWNTIPALSQHLAVLSCTQPCTWHVAVEYFDIFKKKKKWHIC